MDAMRAGGAEFSAAGLPFDMTGALNSGVYELPGHISSQYISALLLALPLLEGECAIALTTPLQSPGYVELTLDILRRFGVRAEKTGEGYIVPGPQPFCSPGELSAPGDWSNAAYLLTAGAIGGRVTVTGLDMASPQGDRAICAVLRCFGAEVEESGCAVTVGPGELRGCTVDLRDTPDLLPALAVAAALAKGESRFICGEKLRYKESDRISSTVELIRSLGGGAEENDRGIAVAGGGLSGGDVNGRGDHRIVMAAAIAALSCPGGAVIRGAEAVNKSYPGFFRDIIALGGEVNVHMERT